MKFNTKEALLSKITKEDILSSIDEYTLFCKYLGNFKIGSVINSPFRKDSNPSFCVYYSKKFDKLFFTDYGTKDSGDIFVLVQKLYNISNTESIKKIASDIGKEITITINNKTNYKNERKYNQSTINNIGVVRQEFQKIDFNYWDQYSISEKTLKKFKVNSIQYYLQNGIVKGIWKEENPIYSYKIFDKFKIYRPLGNKYIKWRCNTTKEDIQGYEQLPKKGNLLIITKSLKDVMVLYEFGINAIAPSSESTTLPDEAIKALKSRFKTLLSLYDRDVAGMNYSRKMMLKHQINPFFINKKWKSKDVSDFVKDHGKEKAELEIKKTICKELQRLKNNNNKKKKEKTAEVWI